jgi:ketosteroid isomerase-like protein
VGDEAALDELREANARFYRALEQLDLPAMDALWAHAGWVRCVQPGWEILVGWEAVRQSWEQIFANTRWLRVTPTAVEAMVAGNTGLVVCSENITATTEGDVGVAVAQATHVFRKAGEEWRMIHHHASPAPVSVTQPFNGTAQ